MSENTNNKKEDSAKLIENDKTTITEKVEEVVAEDLVAEVPAEEPTVEDVVEEPVVEDVKTVITAPEQSAKPGLGFVGNGAMGVATFKEEKKPAAKKTEKKKDTVAVHSTRNVTWAEVGKVYIGYNIVTKEQADKWLTRDHIRLATPEEVAREFGN